MFNSKTLSPFSGVLNSWKAGQLQVSKHEDGHMAWDQCFLDAELKNKLLYKVVFQTHRPQVLGLCREDRVRVRDERGRMPQDTGVSLMDELSSGFQSLAVHPQGHAR